MDDEKKKKVGDEDELDADAVEDAIVGDVPDEEDDESEWTDGIEDTEDEY
jgi:hypothetical protein